MGKLVEVAEFTDDILRLDLDTPVMGYDGTEIGSSNEQAQALANRTQWLKNELANQEEELTTQKDELSTQKDELADQKQQIEEINKKKYVTSVNDQQDAVELDYADVGAAAKQHTHTPDDIKTTEDASFVSAEEKKIWSEKQEQLISEQNIKSVGGESLLGEGNVDIHAESVVESADYQFVSEQDKQRWDGKQDTLSSGKTIKTLSGQSLLGEGDIKLTAEDVGADKSGTAAAVMDAHTENDNPHPQYLSKKEGASTFVPKDSANKPLGYLRLDENGYLPTDIAKLYEAHYYVAKDEAERLKLPSSKNITICLQIDDNSIHYLNPNTDPTVGENWLSSGDSVLSDVTSVFGRSGVIVARPGDYNADQITETEERVFVSPSSKSQWDEKQEKLVSGETIKTLNNQSLLGASNIDISPETIGAADKEHKHDPSDIKTDDEQQFVSLQDKADWSGKQDQLVSGTNLSTVFGKNLLAEGNVDISDAPNFTEYLSTVLKPAGDISITFNEVDKTVVITKKARNINIKMVNDAVAEQAYSYPGVEDVFDFTAYALKEVLKPGDQDFVIDYDVSGKNIPTSPAPTFDKNGFIPNDRLSTGRLFKQVTESGQTYFTSGDIEKPLDECQYMTITVDNPLQGQVPAMTSSTTVGLTAAIYSAAATRWDAYKAFQKEMNGTESNSVPTYSYWSDNTQWSRRSGATWIGIDFGEPRTITAYGFQKFKKFAYYYSTPISGWLFQGRLEEKDEWVHLDSKFSQRLTSDDYGWTTYHLDGPVKYRYYRIYVLEVVSSNGYCSIPRLQFYNDVNVLINGNDNNYYTVDKKGDLKKVTYRDLTSYDKLGFSGTTAPIDLSKMADLWPIRVQNSQYTSISLKFSVSSPQLAIHWPLRDESIWDNLKHLLVASYYNDSDENQIRFAVTTDGKTFYVLKDNQWSSIGTLDTTQESADSFIKDGMLLSALDDITGKQWGDLLADKGNSARLGLGYCRRVSRATDRLTPKTVEGGSDETVSWEMTGPNDVEISVIGPDIQFIPASDGNFKFCYRFYE